MITNPALPSSGGAASSLESAGTGTPVSFAQPIVPDERLVTVDVLRGVAVLGILVMNIQFFAMPESAYSNPSAYGNLEGGNYAVWMASYVFANLKFITLFSMLFGAGTVLMLSRAESRGVP